MAEIQLTEAQVKEYAEIWANALCECAGEDDTFCANFKEALFASEGVYSEYVHYMLYHDFSCKYKIQGVDLIDIMIWQRDHFKADLDMGHNDMKDNGDKMLLMAFHTMLLMEKNPEHYVNLLKQETGSDYPGKF